MTKLKLILMATLFGVMLAREVPELIESKKFLQDRGNTRSKWAFELPKNG